MSTGRFASLVAQAREASFDEMLPGDENRLFYKLPVRKRVIIMLGGPVMNLVLAFLFSRSSLLAWFATAFTQCGRGCPVYTDRVATHR